MENEGDIETKGYIDIRANDSSIMEDIRLSQKQFLNTILPRIKNIQQERDKRKIIQLRRNKLHGFTPILEPLDWKETRTKKLADIKKTSLQIESPRAKNDNKRTIPTWLPPIHKQHIHEPTKRDLANKQSVKTIPLSEIRKSRYLRLPDQYLPKI